MIKPQIGLFEPMGTPGMDLLSRITRQAKASDLMIILDAKRGDIGSTANGYARAYLGPEAVFPCDAITLNPYMGTDTLEPFVRTAETENKGIAVLVRTSNPGSKDFQELRCGDIPLYEHVARALIPISDRLRGNGNYSSLMIVVGAHHPDQARHLREILPHALFLVPGFGAQGVDAGGALAGLVHGPRGWEGGIVNSSRGILYPPRARDAKSLKTWREAFLTNFEQVIKQLSLSEPNS